MTKFCPVPDLTDTVHDLADQQAKVKMNTPDTSFHRIATVIALAMALGPLTALSFGSRYADEETLKRAHAGTAPDQPSNALARYDMTAVIPTYAQQKSLMDITANAGVFDRFESAVQIAGMEQVLSAGSPYTVFLPTDSAMSEWSASLSGDAADVSSVEEFVKSHIVPGRISATDLLQIKTLTTLNGNTLQFANTGSLMVGSAEVIKTETAANGVVHVVDAVL